MLVKVSNPLKRSHVWVLLEDSLHAYQQYGLHNKIGYLQSCDSGAVGPVGLSHPALIEVVQSIIASQHVNHNSVTLITDFRGSTYGSEITPAAYKSRCAWDGTAPGTLTLL